MISLRVAAFAAVFAALVVGDADFEQAIGFTGNGTGQAHTGTDPAARADSIRRMMAALNR